jgi:histidinol-phosphate aminotransferase
MTTSFAPQDLIGARVRSLQEYAPEPLEEAAARLGLPVGQMIKLDANENPYGPTRRASAILTGYAHYHHYPDPISRRLCAALGAFLGVAADTILVGNGSDELIDLILKLFRPGPQGGGMAQLINCPPTFGMYSFYGATNDLEVLSFPRDAAFGVDVAGMEALCRADPRPRLLFLASPNNPDGRLLPDAELERLLALPLLLILDEAYVDFSTTPSRAPEVAQRENLIVLRTFSKWAGLAGLRVGYGIFPKSLMSAFLRLKSPYNVNGPAQAAALATLEDLPEARANIAKIIAERERLAGRLAEFPFLRLTEGSQANYLLAEVQQGVSVAAVKEVMERRGILLRYYGEGRLRDGIRFSVGTPMQNEAVLVALRTLQGGVHGR